MWGDELTWGAPAGKFSVQRIEIARRIYRFIKDTRCLLMYNGRIPITTVTKRILYRTEKAKICMLDKLAYLDWLIEAFDINGNQAAAETLHVIVAEIDHCSKLFPVTANGMED